MKTITQPIKNALTQQVFAYRTDLYITDKRTSAIRKLIAHSFDSHLDSINRALLQAKEKNLIK